MSAQDTVPYISTHALREEGDRTTSCCNGKEVISTHALREEGDSVAGGWCIMTKISTHALREEGDSSTLILTFTAIYFYPRPPRGGRPATISGSTGIARFLPTPSARRATKTSAGDCPGCRFLPTPSARRATQSPTVPLAQAGGFLPTPSARRATLRNSISHKVDTISTHALREEGDQIGHFLVDIKPISTHALREEGDQQLREHAQTYIKFLPTPSARRATGPIQPSAPGSARFLPTPSARRATKPSLRSSVTVQISTHALREEGDPALAHKITNRRQFLPTPSARRATVCHRLTAHDTLFLPTPSARRATQGRAKSSSRLIISTHALREEGDIRRPKCGPV